MNQLKLRIIDQLLNHLEDLDCDEIRPKKEVEITSVGVEPSEDDAGEQGPMDKLVADAGEESEPPKPEDNEEELSDEELEELMKEHLR